MLWRTKVKEEVEPCEECRHLVQKSDMQEVKLDKGAIYYCPEHKKSYDRVSWRISLEWGSYLGSFYKEMEVDENGTPIGYEKAEESPKSSGSANNHCRKCDKLLSTKRGLAIHKGRKHKRGRKRKYN